MQRLLLAWVLMAFWVSPAYAETPTPSPTPSPEESAKPAPAEKAEPEAKPGAKKGLDLSGNAIYKRALAFFHLNVFGFGIMAPTKAGLSLGVNLWQYATIEAEYMSGSMKSELFDIELQEFKEQVMTVKGRIYPTGKSFNGFLGWGRRDLDIELLDFASTYAVQEGIEVGIGNRWSFSVVSVSVDWLSVYKPVGVPRYGDLKPHGSGDLLDSELKEGKKNLEKLTEYPTVTVLKLGVGLQF